MKKHKTGIIFALVMLASAGGGAILGIGASRGAAQILSMAQHISSFLQQNAVWGMGLVLLIELGWGTKLLLSARRAVNQALSQTEDDRLLDAADALCDRGVSLMSIGNIVAFLCLSLGVSGLDERLRTLLFIVILLALFIASMIANTCFTSQFVKLTGVLYPEKTASVLSMKFQKEWFASCDEAERQQIGQASYRALLTGQHTCACMMAAVMLTGMLFDTGILPIVAVATVWLALVGRYLSACYKNRKKSDA